MSDASLDYIPALIAAYRAGHVGDHVHLGYWPEGANLDWPTAQDAMTDLHLDALDLRNGMAVVDLGCGLGGSLRHIDGRLENAVLTGVNIDPRQLEICQSREAQNGNRFAWIMADAGAVPLPDGGTDRVLSLEAMFHFPNRLAFLQEAARLLASGGLLVCSDIHFETPQSPEIQQYLDVVRQGYAPWPDPVHTVNAVLEGGTQAGLIHLRSSNITAQVRPTWDHITSPRDDPKTSPVAAMRALQRAGLLRYHLFVFQKA